MRCLEHRIAYRWGEEFTLWNLGDLHKGARHHTRALLKADVARIAEDPRARWICTGDVGDLILPGDKRFRASELHPEILADVENGPQRVIEWAVEDLAPIADKCFGIVEGNHDVSNSQRHFRNVPSDVAGLLHVPYLGSRGLLRVVFTRGTHAEVFVVDAWHGTGGGFTAAAASAALQRAMAAVDADLHFIGHFHRKAMVKVRAVGVTRHGEAKVTKRQRLGVACGAYLDQNVDGFSDYAETGGLPAWDLGMVGVVISPEERTLKVRE